ncbi:uncharacterized protein EV422DRAFT_35270 [Fimicolochytrium jonesii]|uniref:uncharacterized protein n=1 Tax=Fimicolochytrium jonesii TaxID=1396493 RepID=UPI0022FEDCC0|nr:uncharacterized protein EV422DRAFT_35270 [Fimicolochytrium jonesii]KAI8821264.1 hypothetical protein EV422DRAFT_35270 [Fimicolochytrium jonesii]
MGATRLRWQQFPFPFSLAFSLRPVCRSSTILGYGGGTSNGSGAMLSRKQLSQHRRDLSVLTVAYSMSLTLHSLERSQYCTALLYLPALSHETLDIASVYSRFRSCYH